MRPYCVWINFFISAASYNIQDDIKWPTIAARLKLTHATIVTVIDIMQLEMEIGNIFVVFLILHRFGEGCGMFRMLFRK